MPLALMQSGTKATLRAIRGGRGLRGRLCALGLIPGAEVEVLRNGGGGPCVVSVGGNRIVLGRGMAMQIEVD
jgi:ferrous iron transport protein A